MEPPLLVPSYFGTEQVTDEDRAYSGSRFSTVRDALFANPYQKVWGGQGEPPLPRYDVTLASVLRGALAFGRPYIFRQATERAVDSGADLRWGVNGQGFRRLLHPNGVCLTGLWEITEETGCSGYFRRGSRALIVGRYSTCCAETRRGQFTGGVRRRVEHRLTTTRNFDLLNRAPPIDAWAERLPRVVTEKPAIG